MTCYRPPHIHSRFERSPRGERAFALPLALIILIVFLVIGLALLEGSRMDAVRAAKDVQGVQALAAAEIGLERAVAMSKSQNAPWADMTYNGSLLVFQSSSDPLYQGHQICDLFATEPVGGDLGATYSVVIEDLTGLQYRIHAFGTAGTRSHHVTMDMLALTYASFAWFTNDENGIYFSSGDVVEGWVHTNDVLNIWGSPTFKSEVNSAASDVNYAHGGPPDDNPDFQDGLNLDSPTIDLISLITDGHITAIRNRALEAGGIWLGPNGGRPYEVVFLGPGTVSIKKSLEGGGWETVVNSRELADTNGAIYIEDHVMVKGKVNGRVALATPEGKDIQIVDDLIYAYPGNKAIVFEESFDPTDPQFDDRLELVSGRDVIVRKSWNESWGHMYVMAIIITLNGSFWDYHHDRHPQKTLHVYGSLVQDVAGLMGTTTGLGLQKDYKYDTRFQTAPPPYLPVLRYHYTPWRLDP